MGVKKRKPFRLKGVISNKDLLTVVEQLESIPDIDFKLGMTFQDKKEEKLIKKGKLDRHSKYYGTTRFIECSSNNAEDICLLHEKLHPFFVTD